MPNTITQFHRGNGKMARPNISYRDLEARRTTDAYLAEMERKAAGLDEPPPRELKLRVWHLALMILAGVGLCAFLFQDLR